MKVFLIVLLIALAAAAGILFALFLNSGGQNPHVSPPIQSSGALPPTPAPPSTAQQTAAQQTFIPAEWEDGGIFSAAYGEAYEKLMSMSTEEKIGQMLLARCPDENAAGSIQACRPGGFVLFERDFKGKTAEEVISAIRSYQDASDIPMVMAVDEEGGSIVRISSNPDLSEKRFLSPRELYDAGGLELVRQDAVQKAKLLKELGLNLNLAPVADVSQNPLDYMYARTLGLGAQETAQYVEAAVAGAKSGGILSALKHFPGYGNNADTHTGIAVDERPLSAFEQSDFLPFIAGIRAGAECVLVSHNIVRCMDPDVPASLSPGVHEILRSKLGFTGVVLTDDLSMEAVRAALAGNDMLLTSDIEASYSALLAAVGSGELPMQAVDRAVFRILAMKYANGLL